MSRPTNLVGFLYFKAPFCGERGDKVAQNPIKKKATVREQTAAKNEAANKQPRKLTTASKSAKEGVSSVKKVAGKEYYLPMPDNKAGRFLNKRRSFIPKYFREAWAEVKQVTWPNRRESLKLTSAVLIFTIVFGLIITITDYGLDKIFRKVLLDS
jgi:preprotein translocase SecE subunit